MNQRPNSLFGGAMLRLSIAYFYDLGMAMRPLKQLEGGQNLQAVWPDLYAAENALNQFLATDWMWGAIKSSYALGQQLSTAIKTLTSDPAPDRPLTPLEAYSVVSALWAYEPVLRADLSVADTYYVTRKGGYDTWTLITNAEALFPGPLTAKVPDALADVQEAGKCLAFELCTASGIHILRALELVLKAYFKAVTNGAPLPKNRNIGAYIKALETAGVGEEKTLAVLTQIKDLHRNSLMHAEESLTKEDAILLFGIVFSAMAAMLKAIPEPVSAAGKISAPTSWRSYIAQSCRTPAL